MTITSTINIGASRAVYDELCCHPALTTFDESSDSFRCFFPELSELLDEELTSHAQSWLEDFVAEVTKDSPELDDAETEIRLFPNE